MCCMFTVRAWVCIRLSVGVRLRVKASVGLWLDYHFEYLHVFVLPSNTSQIYQCWGRGHGSHILPPAVYDLLCLVNQLLLTKWLYCVVWWLVVQVHSGMSGWDKAGTETRQLGRQGKCCQQTDICKYTRFIQLFAALHHLIAYTVTYFFTDYPVGLVALSWAFSYSNLLVYKA